MPRVHHVKKSRKDNPVTKKGGSYYWWKFRYGGKRFSLTFPRPSQLTNSDKLSRYYEAMEIVEDISEDEGAIDQLQEALDIVTEVGEEYQESADNIREYFPDGEVAEECEEKAGECEATVASIEEVMSKMEDGDDAPREDLLNEIEWSL